MTQMDKVEMIQWLELKRKLAVEDQREYVLKGDIREADRCSTRALTFKEVQDKLISIL